MYVYNNYGCAEGGRVEKGGKEGETTLLSIPYSYGELVMENTSVPSGGTDEVCGVSSSLQ